MTILLPATLVYPIDLHNVLTDYTVSSWSQKDGLPPGSIGALAQDRAGYLWVGTDSGLFRFDGVRFTSPDTFSRTKLPRGSVRVLHVASDGALWIGFADTGGISCWRDGEVRNYGSNDGLSSGAVYFIAEDSSRSLWAGTAQGLFRWSANRWEHSTGRHGLPEGPVYSGFEDRQRQFFVGHGSGVFRRLADDDGFEMVEASTDQAPLFYEIPRSLNQDVAGRLIITDPVAGFRRVGERARVPAPAQRGRGRNLLRDRLDNLWLGTIGQGLWRLKAQPSPASFMIERLTSLTGLLSDGVMSLFEDRDGNIWVGTTEGLNRLTRRKVTPITDIGLVSGVEITPDGSVWVGTVDEVIRFADATIDSPTSRISLRHATLRAMYADPDGRLWVATAEHVGRVVAGRIAPVPALDRAMPHEVDAITSDGAGGMWLHDLRQGFYHWACGRVERVPLPAGLQRTRVMATFTDSTGRVWIAFAEGPLATITPAGALRVYGRNEGANAGPYRAIHEDRAGTVWLGGADGLTRYSSGRFLTVKRSATLPIEVTAIVEDGEDSLYLGTASGIVHVRKGDFDDAVTTGALRYRLYDRSDGLAGLPLTYSNNRRVVRAADNRLWFVTARGITVIDPRALDETVPVPIVAIEAVVADDRRFPATSQIALPPRTARLEIDYNLLNLTSPFRTRFRYRLEGFDSDWVDGGSRRQAFYTNLPPRRYRFRVAASTPDGQWSEAGGVWDFSIKPTFYQTNWFFAAVLTVLSLTIWAAWQLRLRQVRGQFSLLLAERVRLSREIHDTLLQSLVGLALQVDAMSHDAVSYESAREQFVRLRRQVEGYVREARQSIWNLRSPHFKAGDLIGQLREAGEQAASGQPERFAFSTSGIPRPCRPRIAEQLVRIGQEAVTNAVRHGHAPKVRMHLRYEPDSIVLAVSDNGQGFDSAQAVSSEERHYGLISMRERALEIGAAIEISSGIDHGTEITTSVPLC